MAATPDSPLPTPAARELFLGIDGGQTGTQAVLVDGDGHVLGRGAAGPSNHVEMPGGRERLRTAVIDSTNEALAAAGLGRVADVTFEAVYCGMTGEADFKTEIITPIFAARVVRVEHDAPAALAGGTLGAPGIIVIAGTGSVVYGEDVDGRASRAGGWGYVFGDEGSGFGLAREGIRAGLEALDGVGPDTALVPVLTARLGVDDLRLLPMVMYNGHISRDAVAAAARDVLDTWQAGDAVAARVVTAGIEALARRVQSVAMRLSLQAPRVCLSGGVFRSAPYVDAFRAAVVGMLPGATVEPARLSPAEGAALLAFRAAGRPLTDALRSALVKSSMDRPEPRALKSEILELKPEPALRDASVTNAHAQQLIAHLRNRLIVSCQAPAESPLHDPYVIARLALAAERQGAGAVRIDSPSHVAATRALVSVPIIGIHKQVHDGSAVYITPTCSAAAGVIEAGADIVAVDATQRHRPHGERLADIIGIIRAHGRLVMADVATEAQGLAAADLGVDLIATTLSGYTEDSVRHPGPDLTLVERLATGTRLPVIAEGRIRTANDVRQAFRAGAFAVVVGGAITGIDAMVRHFIDATPSGLAEARDA